MNKRLLWLLVPVLALLIGCGGSSSGKQPTSSSSADGAAPQEQPIPPDLRADIARSIEIGVKLYAIDQVAALATDVLLANVEHPGEQGVVGYLPLNERDDFGNPRESYLVSFFTGDAPPRVAYEVRIASRFRPEFRAFSPAKEQGPEFAALVRVRQLAIAAMPATQQPINPVLLPGAALDEPGVLVYLLAGTEQPDVAVFGKHFRAVVPLAGTSVKSMTALSNSALEVPTRGPNGENVEGLVVTHVVTDFPLETHVFTSLLHQKPVYISTRRGLWRVDGDKVGFFGK